MLCYVRQSAINLISGLNSSSARGFAQGGRCCTQLSHAADELAPSPQEEWRALRANLQCHMSHHKLTSMVGNGVKLKGLVPLSTELSHSV